MKYESQQIQQIPVALIRPNPDQPRTFFDEEFIKGLAGTIKQSGVNDPLLLKRLGSADGVPFEIVKGENRWRAAKLAGLAEVPALIAQVSDKREQFKLALVSDVLKNDLGLPDLARGLKRLESDCGMSQSAIAKFLGQSQAWVWQRLQLLKLGEATLKLMGPETSAEQRLPFSKALLMLNTSESDQAAIATAVRRDRLSVGATRHLVVKVRASRKDCAPIPIAVQNPDYVLK